MHNASWDDLRYVLSVAETGSVSAAARALGVNHATVLRHVAAFEDSHGAQVFERTHQGYQLRPDRAHVIDAARKAALALRRVSHLMRDGGGGLGDTLRLTSTDTFCTTVLAAGLAGMSRDLAPQRISLMSSNAHLDMARLQADVAVRPALARPADMAGDSVAELGFGAYARDGAVRHWLGLAGPLVRATPAQWMSEHVAPDDIVACADSFVALRAMALAGQGIAILPHILAQGDPGLQPMQVGLPAMRSPIWVLCHRDLADSPGMQRVMTVVGSVLIAAADRLRGP
ncbi:LysR family transcriptional regulator [Marinovum sp. 2_MG-2023]|uniref:LysR family transcriptional regulator n=1 Tax=unclassified Marinovum TaxID=2647166 RepID=UPI0026E1D69F|nr:MULTISPECIES: LysR family transcriptional regulator [unclassified Marinovum]MDO6731083.1 LysR family transcriptional regulator [Marinovum sp. 2_MG-2023]MDO6778580.1 LysR family transcriptional regulator [Marinovum sp. 1_MG-2023]